MQIFQLIIRNGVVLKRSCKPPWGVVDLAIGKREFDKLLVRAYRLARFLHCNERDARRILEDAITLLPATHSKPKGLQESKNYLQRTHFNETQWLYFLILYLSEKTEVDQEREKPPTQRDLIKRYIKFLVQISLPNTALYVSVGLTRLLYHYQTSETNRILETLDPERVLEDASLNRVKGNLYRDIKLRFGPYLKEQTGPNREKLFEEIPDPQMWNPLVEDCLEFLTPWGTSCGEMVSGIGRSHQLIHPPCLRALCRRGALALPENQLRLPKGGTVEPHNDNGLTPHTEDLSEREKRKLRERYQWVRRMRGGFRSCSLRLRVNGEDRMEWSPETYSVCQFSLTQSDRILEVWGDTAEASVPFGVFVLPESSKGSEKQEIMLGENRVIRLFLSESGRARQAQISLGKEAKKSALRIFLGMEWWNNPIDLPAWALHGGGVVDPYAGRGSGFQPERSSSLTKCFWKP